MEYPSSMSAAVAIGSPYFLTGRPCVRGHIALRYTAGGRCSHCQRERNAAKRGKVYVHETSRAAKTMARVNAVKAGEAQYVPLFPCKHGHSLRWTATGNCVECGNEGRKRHMLASRYARIKREYGLTREQYHALIESQSSRCAICGTHEENHFSLHIDHCHDSMKVRGLLCGKCNQALGLFGDDVANMESAIEYLKRHAT